MIYPDTHYRIFEPLKWQEETTCMVMLHGWGQSLESLKQLASLLAYKQRVLLVDLPGFGKSKLPTGIWGASEYAKHIKELLDRLSIEKAALVGHSFGGKIAASLAIEYPEKVNQLILIGASGLKRKHRFKSRLRLCFLKLAAKFLKALDRWFKSSFFEGWFVPTFASSDYKSASCTDAKLMRSILVRSVNEELGDLEKIQSPTLLLWGSRDEQTPLDVAYKFHRKIKKSELLVLDRKGHYPFDEIGSHLCAFHIEAFLKRASL